MELLDLKLKQNTVHQPSPRHSRHLLRQHISQDVDGVGFGFGCGSCSQQQLEEGDLTRGKEKLLSGKVWETQLCNTAPSLIKPCHTLTQEYRTLLSRTHHILREVGQHSQIQHLCRCLLHLLLALSAHTSNQKPGKVTLNFTQQHLYK